MVRFLMYQEESYLGYKNSKIDNIHFWSERDPFLKLYKRKTYLYSQMNHVAEGVSLLEL